MTPEINRTLHEARDRVEAARGLLLDQHAPTAQINALACITNVLNTLMVPYDEKALAVNMEYLVAHTPPSGR